MDLLQYLEGEARVFADSTERFALELALACDLAGFFNRLRSEHVGGTRNLVAAQLFLVASSELNAAVSQVLRRQTSGAQFSIRKAIEAVGVSYTIQQRPELAEVWARAYPNSGNVPKRDPDTGKLRVDPKQWKASKEYKNKLNTGVILGHKGEAWVHLRATYAEFSVIAAHAGLGSAIGTQYRDNGMFTPSFADDADTYRTWHSVLMSFGKIWEIFWEIFRDCTDRGKANALYSEVAQWWHREMREASLARLNGRSGTPTPKAYTHRGRARGGGARRPRPDAGRGGGTRE